MDHLLQEGERIDQLVAQGVQIIQSPDVFSFSLDAVLLAHFASIPKRGTIIDFCSGNGAVALFMSPRTQATIVGIELQDRLADMGKRSIILNQLENQLEMKQLDIKEITTEINSDSVDFITCNPPYFKEQPNSKKNPNPYYAIARHEIHLQLDDVFNSASKILKMNGKIAMVHRPDRLMDILDSMRRHRIAPKRIQFIYPKEHKEANTILIEGIKDGKTDGLKILPPLYVYGEDNQYLPVIKEMLHGSN
ncbi:MULTISPECIES: tRNA1(Val) (adenine(37)-N6)-methyltransferase [Vagococcus]|uniref:tRNA (Adenine37-N(6))-methyltransferase TrmN6 n=1 Tax=Vagococcus fluvialis bH819 TaxID=1255619 RepID=A0A1X6WML9_9ENTE|nr:MULTISPECIES: tRNA1(Val) (adenine(37)-N6)-methyltransferase [Vagococcus]SLM85515.1 tRNA (adenine37-N(6))-methyltransferase TrmN6 [Vagococcus fluvialis bH819]HCM89483.1 tRNA1(Val) (adenine(37)-N6)-methyltransferase [Vagococcus sp.]